MEHGVFQMADEKRVPCILNTDGRLKMEKYCHFGMRLVQTRRITEKIRMYDWIREPGNSFSEPSPGK